MCTAIAFCKGNLFFGRTLDAPTDFDCSVISVPRRAPLLLSENTRIEEHYAALGMGMVYKGNALLFDGLNEWGLAGAALNFPGKAEYLPTERGAIASYEVLSYTLATCKNLWQVRGLLENKKISSLSVSDTLPPTPLHWIFADGSGALILEQTHSGSALYDSWCEVMTNSPEIFEMERLFLAGALHLSPRNPKSSAEDSYISDGKGTVGLAGGFDSKERFLRAAYMRRFSVCESKEDFFHIADTVSIPRGAVTDAEGNHHYTRYTACMDGGARTYHYRTYDDFRIRSYPMTEKLLNGEKITALKE